MYPTIEDATTPTFATAGLSPKLFAEMERDYAEMARNELAPTSEEIEAMAAKDAAEYFGTIDPNTSVAFLISVKFEHGRSDFLEVLPSGIVQAQPWVGGLEPTEANAIRRYVADHNAWWEKNREEAHRLCEEWKQQRSAETVRKSA